MKSRYVLSLTIFLLVACSERVYTTAPVANVPGSPWVLAEKSGLDGAEIFASCASCHMADGSGRSDGFVPRLAGQSKKVLIQKLQNLHLGKVTLPVMEPFARALTDEDIAKVAHFISSFPSPDTGVSSNKNYSTYCASCHGASGQGNDALLAPKLCGQHAAYINRRMVEIEKNLRGDANEGMRAVLAAVKPSARDDISQWLSKGKCESSPQAGEKL